MKRVYYFSTQKYALEDISLSRVKVSRVNDLNDPFELLAADLINPKHRQAFAKFKNQLNNIAGLICFSKSWSNPLLWGHYADKHTGIALGFDVSDDLLIDVRYTSFRPRVEFDEANRVLVKGHNVVDKLIRTKFVDWKYEDESRIYVQLDHTVTELEHHFFNFSSDLILREVVLGMNCKVSIAEIRKLTDTNLNQIRIKKAGMALRKFRIIEDRSYRGK